MSRIDELIARHCPDGVPYEILSDVAKLERGTSITQKQVTAGSIPVVAGGRTPAYFHADFNRDGESIVIAGSGAYAGFVSWWEGPIFVSDAFSISTKAETLLPKYCFHWLSSKQNILHSLKSGGGVPHVYAKDVGKLRIPVPPLEVQREIVRILDQFTQLEAELEAELEARRRQYDHYRQEALKPGADTRWSTLGAISTRTSSGGTPRAGSAKYYENGTIPWLRTSEVRFGEVWKTEVKITQAALDETSAKWIPENCVIIAISGATAGRSAVNKIPLTTNQHCCNLEIDPEQADYRYVFYWVAANYEKLKSLGRGARADLNSALIKAFEIPLPSLSKQREIVALLEKFDALVNDISVGLPAELAARRTQYEYYRDKLLTFEEAAA